MKEKKKNPSRYIIMLIMIVVSGYCIMEVVKEINTTFTLRADISEAKKEKAELSKQKEKLQKEKSNLNNKEYIIHYARGKYMLTKEDGEQVFKLPTEEK
ncbi:cell division protein FtsB [Breznakia sp. PF5-3]|uniref:septum formation initiator family protein n=1 Tax=unclassified Breznakia TaxID=2623764 RepID=UPI002405E2F5|nr:MULTISPECIES: septum formation initiator family protein [unclassified Breznakia]MDF9825731.1 cell division protein FtsB [Breznakia sp. PM6-1]MDF9836077.1 cell division protein FtsB [Breznakia sp. PF5-3]MDF9838296.1 cell division protein FtsB [Breznakia sp. PFB2-8]MDF9860308.1 cell division protein FtsB [Breznakia sp. PH5-24]